MEGKIIQSGFYFFWYFNGIWIFFKGIVTGDWDVSLHYPEVAHLLFFYFEGLKIMICVNTYFKLRGRYGGWI